MRSPSKPLQWQCERIDPIGMRVLDLNPQPLLYLDPNPYKPEALNPCNLCSKEANPVRHRGNPYTSAPTSQREDLSTVDPNLQDSGGLGFREVRVYAGDPQRYVEG